MIVLDASALLELLLRTPAGLRVEERMTTEPAYAPHLLDAEVLHRLVAMGKGGLLDPSEVESGVADLRDAPIERVDHRVLLSAARRLAVALSGYDALYAALAQETGATLVTSDGRLARTAREQFGITALVVSESLGG